MAEVPLHGANGGKGRVPYVPETIANAKFAGSTGELVVEVNQRKARNIMMQKYKVCFPWSEYPIGTKAHAIMGGYWLKTSKGWKWCSGDTFPTPGGDAFSVSLECQDCGADLLKNHAVPFDCGDDNPRCAACAVDYYMKSPFADIVVKQSELVRS